MFERLGKIAKINALSSYNNKIRFLKILKDINLYIVLLKLVGVISTKHSKKIQ